MLNSQEMLASYRNVSCMIGEAEREITLGNTGKILLKQEFSDGFMYLSMNIKDITIPLIIHYYLLGEHSGITTRQSFHAKS